MFSEYASQFLHQSRHQISDAGDGSETPVPNRGFNWNRPSGHLPNRTQSARGPYSLGASKFSAFGGRTASEAPLFHSALNEPHDDDDDDEERDREAADLYALQKSRRAFDASRLDESTEDEHVDASRDSVGEPRLNPAPSALPLRLGNIRSSWTGQTRSFVERALPKVEKKPVFGRHRPRLTSDDESQMEEVGLDSIHDMPSPAFCQEPSQQSPPPTFQKFKDTTDAAREARVDLEAAQPREPPIAIPAENKGLDVPQLSEVPPSESELFKYDPFFAWLYVVGLASLVASFVLVWLHTSTPTKRHPWGDTIYTALRSSFHLLAVDTLVSIVVSIVWLAALRAFMKPIVRLVMVAVPILLVSFTLYPFISSFQGPEHGSSPQDVAMRWSTIVPAASTVAWLYMAWKGRHAINASIELLEFSGRILAANSALILMGMATLTLVVFWTWAWLAMFTRVFLGGHFSSAISRFIISTDSWWLGAFFVLEYIWTLSVISGVQRATTAATVSQWYFHRNVQPVSPSREIVLAAFAHSTTTVFGCISQSTFLALILRLPLIILPRRIGNSISMVCRLLVPTPIAQLTNPLVITYAGIHSMSLADSGRGLTRMEFLAPNTPTTTLTPRAFRNSRSTVPLLPYRLAKLILHATRFAMALALGFAGWVMTARQLSVKQPDGLGNGRIGSGFIMKQGSAYAYVVGLVASFIGWGVLGAMDNVLSGILDAVVVCYGSERKMAGQSGVFCIEAARLLGPVNNGSGMQASMMSSTRNPRARAHQQ